jgi:glycerophosphoryl diester phosphodiesterase
LFELHGHVMRLLALMRPLALRRDYPPRQLIAAVALLTLAGAAAAFELQGHRGARGLAPENTLAAFRTALDIGVTTLESDLAVTRDGVLVLSHDPRLNPDLVRDANGHWLAQPGPPIRSLTSEELRRYDVGRLNPASRYAQQWPAQRAVDGERIPTLAELFALVRNRRAPSGTPVRLNLETKITPTSGEEVIDPAGFVRLLVTVVQGARLAGRVTVQSFDWRTLLEVRRVAPDIETSCLTIESPNMNTVQADATGASPWHAGLRHAEHGSLPRLAKAAGCGVWSPFWRNVTPALVAEAHALGLKVLPWTVNETADMAALIEARVDGIITDYPDRLRELMRSRNMAPP